MPHCAGQLLPPHSIGDQPGDVIGFLMISILVLDKNNNNVDDTCAFDLNSSNIKTMTTGRCCNWFKVCYLDLRFFVLVHLEINKELAAVTVNICHESSA